MPPALPWKVLCGTLWFFPSKLFTHLTLHCTGIPANPNRDFQWLKVKESKRQLCKRMFQMMPHFFHHHQIDLAQRDGLKINLSQITSESFLLLLIADYAENYTHLAQVTLTIVYIPIIWFFPIFLNIYIYFLFFSWWVKCDGFTNFLQSF